MKMHPSRVGSNHESTVGRLGGRAGRFAVAVGLASLLAGPAMAREQGWSVRVGGVWADPDVSFSTVDDDGDSVEVGADAELGFGLGLQYRFSPRLGVELGYRSVAPDFRLDVELPGGLGVSATDAVDIRPITLALDVHLTPDGPVDVYAAPVIALVQYGDPSFTATVGGVSDTFRARSDDDFAWGGEIGLGVPIGGGPWSFALSALYLDTTLEVVDEEGERTDLDVDPFIVTLGVSYSF